MRSFGEFPAYLGGGTGAVVVTATIGEPELADAIASVQAQEFPDLRHLVVVDGLEHGDAAKKIAHSTQEPRRVPIDLLVLPRPTGANGYFGHRIYGASSFLVDEEFMFFLDADNVFDPSHVTSCIEAMRTDDAEFAYTLRSIVDTNLQPICDDNCDSLGFWPRYPTYFMGDGALSGNQEAFLTQFPYLIDTNCYGLRRCVLLRLAATWHAGWGADCIFATTLIRSARGVATGRRTVRYRLDSNRQPGAAEYFLEGNRLALEVYGQDLPWNLCAGERFVRQPVPQGRKFGG